MEIQLNKYTRNRRNLEIENRVLYNEIIKCNIKFSNISWSNMLYNYINNIFEVPLCKKCNKPVKFQKFSTGYSQFCSNYCSLTSNETKMKRKKTNLKKFGVENAFQNTEIKKKIKQTNLIKYGVENPMQSKKIHEKAGQTNLIKYGVENTFQSPKIKNKIKNTLIKKYGVDSPIKNNRIKLRINSTINNSFKKKWSEILNITPDDIIILSGSSLLIKNYCSEHNEFIISKTNLINRNNRRKNIKNEFCSECYSITKQSSTYETEVFDFIINDLNIVDIIKNNRLILNNKELDIYIKQNKLAIEFNGLYWHSEVYKEKKYHLDKTEECEELDIQLLHIFEDEWINKKKIVKSIIGSKLGIVDCKIYGRKTEVREINDNKLIRDFLEINHLQGFVGSKIKIGLFYDDELVSLMTFGKKRIAMGNKIRKDGEYEMLRFCNKLNTTVIGGASKLLKYFVKTYHPKSILTFADRRYSNGELYKKLGFEFIENTRPNYWYFKTHELIRHYRFNFRKNVLVKEGYDSNKTESEIMRERGYLRIYDCGNMKFEKLFDFNI